MNFMNGIVLRTIGFAFLIGTTLPVTGCGSGEGGSPSSEATGTVSLNITVDRTNVKCIRFTATPTSGSPVVKVVDFSLGQGSVDLKIGPLPLGTYVLTSDAFNSSCGTIGDWVATPVTISVLNGAVTSVALTYHKNSAIAPSLNFVNVVQSLWLGGPTSFVATDVGILESGSMSGTRTFVRTGGAAFDSTQVAGNAIVSGAATNSGSCVAKADGTVWCWGTNYYGELGSGIPVGATSTVPVQVPGISNVTQIAAGVLHVCASTSFPTTIGSGSGITTGVYCWGYNGLGQLGNGSTIDSAIPVRAMSLSDVKWVAAGAYSTYAVTSSRSEVYGWGYNSYGQVGDGTTVNRLSPYRIVGESPVQSVVAGYGHACARRVDGTVRCWGNNADGELGDGSTTNRLAPTLVGNLVAKQITAGQSNTCAITTSGTAVCWGYNLYGAVGDASNVNRLVPTSVSLGTVQLTTIGSSPFTGSFCGISTTQDVYCWGINGWGNLGDGTLTTAYVPVLAQLQ